jgi:hypothetical protein
MPVFSFDVEVSDHDHLRRGVLAYPLYQSQHTWHRVVVAADTIDEAALVAQQIACCHGMCTAIYPRI